MRFPFSDHDLNDNDPVIFIDPQGSMGLMLADTVASEQEDIVETIIRAEQVLIQRTGRNLVQTYRHTIVEKRTKRSA